LSKILIVEDDIHINNLLMKSLELMGHSCTCEFDGAKALEILKRESFDLILLDVMLPNVDGFHVIHEVGDTPVIFLTALSDVHDRVKGLTLGAYDYIIKPFEMLELQARVESVLRRTQKLDTSFSLGNVQVDFSKRLVYLNGETVDFTPQEFTLIETLTNNRNIAMSREKLLEIAWGYDYGGDTRTVDVHISSIRRKLHWEKTIKTVYKMGYRLEVK